MAYCQSDVRLLKEGCQKFQEEFEQIDDFNPMEKCNLYFRKKCLQPHTIASEPIRGWHSKSKPHSNVSLEWLYWKEHQLRQTHGEREGDRIIHAGNRGEQRIQMEQSPIYFDGFDNEMQTVYEFLGCFYHGCPTCFPNRNNKHPKHDDMTMHQVYQMTLDCNKAIEDAGYNWEYEWKRQKETHPDITGFLQRLQLVARLEPREALFGGRTNAVHLYAKTKDDEEIRFVDYTSLYPWVNKSFPYPIVHPVIITQPPSNDISRYFGLVKCTTIPPHNLYHPVLPYRCKGKLTFPICQTCVEKQLDIPLMH